MAEMANRPLRCLISADRIPIHQGNGFILAETGGAEEITLTTNQIPAHSHPFLVSGDIGNQVSPVSNVPGNSQGAIPYLEDSPTLNMSPLAIASVGGSQPHNNFQPYLCVDFIISLFGIFPSQT
jgi:microcystin-dependent protein